MAETNEAIGLSRFFFFLAHLILILGVAFLVMALYIYNKQGNDINMFYGLIVLIISLLVYIMLDRLSRIYVDHRFRSLDLPSRPEDEEDDDRY